MGLVPLLVFIADQPAGPAGRWRATRAGTLTGLVYFGFQLYWVAVALLPESPMLAVPAWLLFVTALAGFTGAFAGALHYTLERLGLPLAVLAAILWTTMEWSQGRLGDLAFPWLGLGHALAPFPRAAGAADLVGARGLTFWIAGVNGLLATALLRWRATRSGTVHQPPGRQAGRVPVAAPLALWITLAITVPPAYGYWRAATLELTPAARVAVVQPNIPQAIRRDHDLALDTSLVVLPRLTLAAGGAALDTGPGSSLDLVAWPEVAITADLAADDDLLRLVRDLSKRIHAPILAGAFGGGSYPFNSAILVDADGQVGERYDKRRLVPFIERAPFMGAGRGGMGSGTRGPLFHAGQQPPDETAGGPAGAPEGASFGVLICFESAFANLARAYRRDGADFLVNTTNDAWFGREPRHTWTTALWQHPAHMTMRAIENRVGVARAANTGISLFIDPVGRVRHATPLFVEDVRTATVYTTDAVTLYTRWGDWLATLAALAAAALLLLARGRPAQWLSPRSGRRSPR